MFDIYDYIHSRVSTYHELSSRDLRDCGWSTEEREIRDLLEASEVIKNGINVNDQLFTDKYNICFPMRTKDDLSAFQEMLKINDICRRDFVSFL